MKLAALSILALAACLALWFLSAGTSDAREELTLAGPAAEAERPPSSRELEESPTLEPEPEPEVTDDAPGEARAPALADEELTSEAPAPAPRIPGRVVLIDDDGLQHDELDGQLTVLRWKGDTGFHESLAVRGGVFELDPRDAEGFSFRELVLEGRVARLEDPGRRHAADSSEVVLLARWSKSLTLHIVDAATGGPLSDVTVVRGAGFSFSGDAEHPGEYPAEFVEAEHVASPVVLQPTSNEVYASRRSYFVHSPGMAWRSVQLDMQAGGERIVRLEPGGDLEVTARNLLPPEGSRLRLRREGDRGGIPRVDLPGPGAKGVVVDGLAPGSYRLTVEVGEWYRDPRILAETETTVVAGARTLVDLGSLDLPEVREGRLEGTLTVPLSWKLTDFQLEGELKGEGEFESILLRDEMEPVGSSGETWSFDFGVVPAGSYQVVLFAGGHGREQLMAERVQVDADQVSHLELVLPPPVAVVVRVVEATTGQPATLSGMHWAFLGASRSLGGSLSQARLRDDEPGTWEFTAPAGRISVGAFGGDYANLREEFDVGPGPTERTFQLERNCPLEVRFLDGDTPVPPPGSWWPHPVHLDGEGQLCFTSGGASGLKTALSEPGRYRFEMPDFPDYEPVPDQVVTVQRGEATVHEVYLVRKP